MRMQVFVLGNLLVLLKGLVPAGFRSWRNGTQDRLPFGNGKARVGKAGDTTQNNLYYNHKHANQQPDGNRPAAPVCDDVQALGLERFYHNPAKLNRD